MRLSRARASRALAFAAICALPPLLHLSLAHAAGAGNGGFRLLAMSLAALSAAPHTVAYLTLLVVFALSLRPGREPICTALARKMHGSISDEMATYAGAVTGLWCAFFAAQLAVSLTLFLAAPLAVWSFFVNVLNLPLVAALYAAEYVYRTMRWSDAPRHRFSDLLRLIGHVRETVSKPVN